MYLVKRGRQVSRQYGGAFSKRVTRFEGPTTDTPHAKTSGVNVMPTSAA